MEHTASRGDTQYRENTHSVKETNVKRPAHNWHTQGYTEERHTRTRLPPASCANTPSSLLNVAAEPDVFFLTAADRSTGFAEEWPNTSLSCILWRDLAVSGTLHRPGFAHTDTPEGTRRRQEEEEEGFGGWAGGAGTSSAPAVGEYLTEKECSSH